MCVIMSKPANVAFPEESVLKNCWDNNPDMGGFMYTLNGKVYIHKGYDTWKSFKTALDKAREKTGDNIPYVCHFRISTQGFDKDCCQPFPLSGKMNALKKSKSDSNIGVAHNGILHLTSDGSKTYSDTMKFITDYLVNIIRSYDWYKDQRTVKLIENLIEGSRFAILDKKGHCQLLGKGWIEDKGCYYSNSTYSYKKTYFAPISPYTSCCGGIWDDYWDDDEKRWADYWDKVDKSRRSAVENKPNIGARIVTETSDPEWLDPWDKKFSHMTGHYEFSEYYCPVTEENDDSYCECCSHYGSCQNALALRKASGFEC